MTSQLLVARRWECRYERYKRQNSSTTPPCSHSQHNNNSTPPPKNTMKLKSEHNAQSIRTTNARPTMCLEKTKPTLHCMHTHGQQQSPDAQTHTHTRTYHDDAKTSDSSIFFFILQRYIYARPMPLLYY